MITAVEEDENDPNYEPLQRNLDRLHVMRLPSGEPLHVLTLPMPPRIEREGQRLPASYANFYIANRCVLVPTYRHANDAKALEVLRPLFPGKKVIGIDSTELIWGLGSFHCISQQEPAGGRLPLSE